MWGEFLQKPTCWAEANTITVENIRPGKPSVIMPLPKASSGNSVIKA